MPRIRAASIGEHKALTRGQILVAAQDLIKEVGSADVSLGEVAASVGIGRTTIYEYFRDKDDLIASLVEETLPEVVAELLEGVSGSVDASTRLSGLVTRTVEFVATDPVLGLILHREVLRLSSEAQDRIRKAHAGLADEFGAVYAGGVAAGAFRAIAPDLAGRLIQEVIMAAARTVIAAPDPRRRLDEVTGAMTAFLLHGLEL